MIPHLTYITDEFIRLFRYMGFVVFALTAAGIILITLEMIVPHKGRFAVSGIILVVMSIVLRMLVGGSPAILFLYVAITLIIIVAIFSVIMTVQKSAWINEALRREELRSTPDGSQKRTDYSFLLGLEGEASTVLAPQGQMTLGDTNFLVTSDLGFIRQGRKVRVVEVRGEHIMVQEV